MRNAAADAGALKWCASSRRRFSPPRSPSSRPPPRNRRWASAAGVKNDVRLRKQGSPLPPRPVALKQRIALGDGVQTGAKSQLQVLLLDQSTFSVGANARLTIDRFVYDPNRGRQLGASLIKGAFRSCRASPIAANSAQIRTPVASIGIRGTSFDTVLGETAILIGLNEPALKGVGADPETASLIILHGPGAKTQGNTLPGVIDVTAGGKTVTIDRPQFAVFVPGPGKAPIGPFRMSKAGLMQVQALIFPSIADRLGIRGPADNLGGDPDGVYYPPERPGPDYPATGPYPPGAYPPAGILPRTAPGLDNTPPASGPPPLILVPPPPREPRAAPQGNATPPPANTTNAAGGPSTSNDPPPTTAAPPPKGKGP